MLLTFCVSLRELHTTQLTQATIYIYIYTFIFINDNFKWRRRRRHQTAMDTSDGIFTVKSRMWFWNGRWNASGQSSIASLYVKNVYILFKLIELHASIIVMAVRFDSRFGFSLVPTILIQSGGWCVSFLSFSVSRTAAIYICTFLVNTIHISERIDHESSLCLIW